MAVFHCFPVCWNHTKQFPQIHVYRLEGLTPTDFNPVNVDVTKNTRIFIIFDPPKLTILFGPISTGVPCGKTSAGTFGYWEGDLVRCFRVPWPLPESGLLLFIAGTTYPCISHHAYDLSYDPILLGDLWLQLQSSIGHPTRWIGEFQFDVMEPGNANPKTWLETSAWWKKVTSFTRMFPDSSKHYFEDVVNGKDRSYEGFSWRCGISWLFLDCSNRNVSPQNEPWRLNHKNTWKIHFVGGFRVFQCLPPTFWGAPLPVFNALAWKALFGRGYGGLVTNTCFSRCLADWNFGRTKLDDSTGCASSKTANVIPYNINSKSILILGIAEWRFTFSPKVWNGSEQSPSSTKQSGIFRLIKQGIVCTSLSVLPFNRPEDHSPFSKNNRLWLWSEPHFEASIMDGFAVCSGDGIGTFPVDADAFAGGRDEGPLRPGDV